MKGVTCLSTKRKNIDKLGIKLSFLGVFFSGIIFSQNFTQSIHGKITEKDSKRAVEGAHIIVINSNPIKEAISNKEGAFIIDSVLGGNISLKVKANSFSDIILSNVMVSPDKVIDVTIEMEYNSIGESVVYKHVQLSILPSIRRHAIYSISLNALFSYSHGNRFLNISGIGNVVNGHVRGFQVAGLFNIVKKNALGLQMVGGINYIKDTLKGVQIAGLSNAANYARGIGQVSGGVNKFSHGKLNIQCSGIMGLADSIVGLQVSGIISKTKNVQGVQLAGIATIAKNVKGVQVGLINYADSLSGLQIGLFNFSKYGGYHVVEASANEINYINLSYKSGTRKFYTAFVGGITPYASESVWTYGGGVGTMVKLSRWSDLNIEALVRHVNVGASYNYKRQEWVQLGIYWNIRLSKHLEMMLGPTNNVMFFDKSESNFEKNKSQIFPSFISVKENGENSFVAYNWVGGTVGLRFKF